MGSLHLKELADKKLAQDLSLALEVAVPVIDAAAKTFNSKKGVVGATDDKLFAEFLSAHNEAINQDQLLALISVASYFQRAIIDKTLDGSALQSELREYLESNNISPDADQLSAFWRVVEPTEQYRRRRIASTRGGAGHPEYLDLEGRAELRLFTQDLRDIAVARATIKLKLRTANNESRIQAFECDDEDLDAIIQNLMECRSELEKLMRTWEGKLDIFTVKPTDDDRKA